MWVYLQGDISTGQFSQNLPSPGERKYAVCTPRNLDVIDNNLKIQKSQPGDVNVYKSEDAVGDVNEGMQCQRTDVSLSHLQFLLNCALAEVLKVYQTVPFQNLS